MRGLATLPDFPVDLDAGDGLATCSQVAVLVLAEGVLFSSLEAVALVGFADLTA